MKCESCGHECKYYEPGHSATCERCPCAIRRNKGGMPRGTTTATVIAFENAIRALDGLEPIPVPGARKRVAAKLRKAYAILLRTRTIP